MTKANQPTSTIGSESCNARAMKTTTLGFVTVDALTVVKSSGARRYYLDGKPVAQSKFQRLQSARISADCFITTSQRGVFKHRACWRFAAAAYSNQTTVRNPNPWVVVNNPGQDDEDIVDDFATAAEARACMRQNPGTDLMKRLESGVLTTEY